eukprot:CAMPEP_0168395398 /NCGR_PEP_ID=MMETSP0228-20121227/20023_1 /TAXON_ID=133427 /ORGANISM="Protoceratium reticulatum, Strain CCCM 535 (=CCMP 1889)" /LENGTH=42 /DNA_ID= /DNA_START= /DNA_END= /DNA_ORIENTATION=
MTFVRVFAICAVLMGMALVGLGLTAATRAKVPTIVKGQVKDV